MSEDFFIDVDGPSKKRKLNGINHHKKSRPQEDPVADVVEEEDDGETADEKRLRLAQEYLARLGAVEEEDRPDDDLIAQRLDQDAIKLRGKRFQAVASQLVGHQFEVTKVTKGHQGATTCVAVSPDSQFAVTGSKDGTIVKWDLETLKKVYTIHSRPKKQKTTQKAASTLISSVPIKIIDENRNAKEQHAGGILSVAVSFDGKYLATGGEDRSIIIRELQNGAFVSKLQGHRGGVTGLCFVEGVNNLYSCSLDRTVKIWSMQEMTYVDTLFGHQSEALSISLLSAAKERCVTAGRDQSVRVWKVSEEKQLLFKSGMGNIDSVVALSDDMFVTGADSGVLCVYNSNKKKAVSTIQTHTTGPLPWVTAVGAIFRSDLCASGGSDGFIRLWKVEKSGAEVTEVASIPLEGCVNGISFAGNKLVVAVGQEHRLGRWDRIPKVRNGIAVIPLPLQLEDQ